MSIAYSFPNLATYKPHDHESDVVAVVYLLMHVISNVLGMVETDAYLLFKWFHPGYTKNSHSDFTEAVAQFLLTNSVPINVNVLTLSNRIHMKHYHTTLPH